MLEAKSKNENFFSVEDSLSRSNFWSVSDFTIRIKKDSGHWLESFFFICPLVNFSNWQ